jgi:hypothetical protein
MIEGLDRFIVLLIETSGITGPDQILLPQAFL